MTTTVDLVEPSEEVGACISNLTGVGAAISRVVEVELEVTQEVVEVDEVTLPLT